MIKTDSKFDKTPISTLNTSSFTIHCNDNMLWLFLIIPIDACQKDFRFAFAFEIENVHIIINRETRENTGFGYVRFKKAYDAEQGLMEFHRRFKAKYAVQNILTRKREIETNNKNYLMQNSSSKIRLVLPR